MSGYNRITSLRNYFSSLRNLKNFNKLSTVLGQKINAACDRRDSNLLKNNEIKQIKQINQFLSKELKSIKNGTGKLLFTLKNRQMSSRNSMSLAAAAAVTLKDSKIDYYPYKIIKYSPTNSDEYFMVKTGKYAANGKVELLPQILFKEEDVPEAIPEPPAIIDVPTEALNQLNHLGEPTFASLGLGGWSPVGIVENCMEYLHVTLDVEWWLAIVIGTLFIRLCMFPLVILAQRNAAKMNNYMPQIQLLQLKMSDARQTGDALNAARYSQELMLFMNEKGINPLKNMIVPLAQAPVFISFFMSLREMSNVPVESLRTGGMLWFTDLTLPDQYFLMPIITSLTLWATIELGSESAKLSTQNGVMIKYALRAIPILILPFTVNFPGAMLCYWVSTNFISLSQVAFLRIPRVRKYFKIEPMLKFNQEDLPQKSKGFTEGIKESWTNIKITKELEERRKLDEIQFRRAGKGPVQRTFKYDPTKQQQTIPNLTTKPAISAKER